MNPFAEEYKKLSNSDLLWVINHPDDYQALAIEAAKIELASRHLTPEELDMASNEIRVRESKKQAKIEKELALKKIFKKTLVSMADIIKRPTPKRKIKVIISVILSIIFLVQAFSRVDLIKFMFTNDSAIWSLSMVFYFLPWLLILIGLLLFWFRKKAGWIVLSIYIAYQTCDSIIEFFAWAFREYPENPVIKRAISRMTYLPSLFIAVLFFAGMLWAICRKDIRSDYHINRKTSFLTVGLSFAITTLFDWFNLV